MISAYEGVCPVIRPSLFRPPVAIRILVWRWGLSTEMKDDLMDPGVLLDSVELVADMCQKEVP